MSAQVLLNLLNELWKSDKMRGLQSIFSLFRNEFDIKETFLGKLYACKKILQYCIDYRFYAFLKNITAKYIYKFKFHV